MELRRGTEDQVLHLAAAGRRRVVDAGHAKPGFQSVLVAQLVGQRLRAPPRLLRDDAVSPRAYPLSLSA